MSFNLDEATFRARNRISDEAWQQSQSNWDDLSAIARDHEENLPYLREVADFFARVIQRVSEVHSVRWRVKDTEHLLEKIVRKRAEGSSKYLSLDASNYFERATDLVGIRALHLFKNDCIVIDKALRNLWPLAETPIAYIRHGDPEEIVAQLKENGEIEIKPHSAGYRSVHYIFASQPVARKVTAEVQVRTLFEEGWSEIDHTVRYPNFSDNPLVNYFLMIFNRSAGGADEMGTFVRDLALTLASHQEEIANAKNEKNVALQEMETTVNELGRMREEDAQLREIIRKLKNDFTKLRAAAELKESYPLGRLLGSSDISSIQIPEAPSIASIESNIKLAELLGQQMANLSIHPKK